jgi:hypothetical protein
MDVLNLLFEICKDLWKAIFILVTLVGFYLTCVFCVTLVFELIKGGKRNG